MLTVDNFINNLNNAHAVTIATNQHILSSHLFTQNYIVKLSEYGEINNLKKCIVIEQLDESKMPKHRVRLSLEELSSITNVSSRVSRITYKDGYSFNIFY